MDHETIDGMKVTVDGLDSFVMPKMAPMGNVAPGDETAVAKACESVTYRTPPVQVEEGDILRWGYRWFEIMRGGVVVQHVELSECNEEERS